MLRVSSRIREAQPNPFMMLSVGRGNRVGWSHDTYGYCANNGGLQSRLFSCAGHPSCILLAIIVSQATRLREDVEAERISSPPIAHRNAKREIDRVFQQKKAGTRVKLTSRNHGDNAWLVARLLCAKLTSEDCSRSLE